MMGMISFVGSQNIDVIEADSRMVVGRDQGVGTGEMLAKGYLISFRWKRDGSREPSYNMTMIADTNGLYT